MSENGRELNTAAENRRRAGIVLSWMQTLASALVSLCFTPVLLRFLGQSAFGVYTLVGSLIGYLTLLHFGLGSAYLKFYTDCDKPESDMSVAQLNGIYLRIYCVIAAVVLVLGMILSGRALNFFDTGYTAEEIRLTALLLRILIINLVMTFLTTVFNAYIGAREQFVFQKIIHILRTVLPPLLMLPVLWRGYGAVGVCVVTTAVGILVDFATVYYCLKRLRMRFVFARAGRGFVRKVFLFSAFIAINSIVDQINWQMDKVILSRIHGTTETAVYGVASQISALYISVSAAVAAVYAPMVHRIARREDRRVLFQELFECIGRIQFLLLGLIATGLVLFGDIFLVFWAGRAYAAAYPILLLLLLPTTIPLIENLGIEYQRARSMHYFRSVVYLCMALLNVLISVYLGRRYGGVGCAAGTAISVFFANGIVMNLYYHKKMEVNIVSFFAGLRRSFLLVLALFLTGWTMRMMCETFLVTPGGFLAVTGSYAGLYVLVVFIVPRIKKRMVTHG